MQRNQLGIGVGPRGPGPELDADPAVGDAVAGGPTDAQIADPDAHADAHPDADAHAHADAGARDPRPGAGAGTGAGQGRPGLGPRGRHHRHHDDPDADAGLRDVLQHPPQQQHPRRQQQQLHQRPLRPQQQPRSYYQRPVQVRRPPVALRPLGYSQVRRVVDSEGGPDGGPAPGDAALQHGQVLLAEPGHASHREAGPGAPLHPQRRPAALRQVRPGPLAGHRLRAPLQAQALGQAHRERPRQLPQDARLGLRRERRPAPQVPHPEKR